MYFVNYKIYIGRNAIVVIMSACIAYALATQDKTDVFTLVKKLPEGIPSVELPTVNKEVIKVIINILKCIYLSKISYRI